MQFRDIFTKDVQRDPYAVSMLTYCLNSLADIQTDFTSEDISIPLLQHEMVVDFRDAEYELRQGKDIIIQSLEKLEKSRKIEILQRELPFYKVKVKGIQFPINATIEKVQVETQIYPIVFDEWMRRDIKCVERTFTKKYYNLVKIVLKDFSTIAGEKMLHDLTRMDYEEYLVHLGKRKKKLSDCSINNYTRILKASLSRALEKRHIKVNPFALVKERRLSKKEPLTVSVDEIKYIMDFIGNPVLKKAVFIASMTGMRKGEITYLKWSDVDFGDEKIHIQSSSEHKTKFGKKRYTPLTKQLVEVLMDLRHFCEEKNIHSEYVFPNETGGHFHESYMLTMLKRAVEEAGANPEITFHTLRRSFATMLKTSGTNINVIRGLLGHSSERTTALYIGVPEDEMDSAISELHGSKFANG